MGSVCCCFSVSDVGGHAAANDQNHIFCKCFSCCFQNLINKCGTIFGQAQETARNSANQGTSSSTAHVAINSSCNTIRSQDGGLPNSAASRQLQMQEDVAFKRQEKGTSHSRVEPEPDIDADVEITQKLLKADKLLKSYCANEGPSSSTAVVPINSSCNTIRSQDGGLPNSAASRVQPQMQQDVAFGRQDEGTSHPRVEPEPDIDADVEITQKLLKADKLLQSDSDNQGTSTSTAIAAINNSCNTIRSQDRGLSNSAAPRLPQMQEDVASEQQDKTTSHSRVEPEPDADVEITEELLKQDKLLKSDHDRGSKECCPESPKKDYSSMILTGVQYEVSSSEDEDVCPTCLEEYTPENPKILTKCSHHYHLSCIYEWQERSEKCPVCGKLMEFEETN